MAFGISFTAQSVDRSPIKRQENPPAKLGPKDGTAADDFIFPLAPRRMPWQGDAVYVPIPVASADYAAGYRGPPPVSWNRNQPERINLEFMLVDARSLGGGQNSSDDIETEIATLQAFRFKRAGQREPQDLIYQFGKQVDRVRIERMGIDPTLWTSDGRRCVANCTLQLVVVMPRSGR